MDKTGPGTGALGTKRPQLRKKNRSATLDGSGSHHATEPVSAGAVHGRRHPKESDTLR